MPTILSLRLAVYEKAPCGVLVKVSLGQFVFPMKLPTHWQKSTRRSPKLLVQRKKLLLRRQKGKKKTVVARVYSFIVR